MLEVLVAFAIAALALSVLFQGALAGLRSAGVAGRYQEALSRARSHLAAIGGNLTATDLQGEDGLGEDTGTPPHAGGAHKGTAYHWHVRVSPIASTVRGGDMTGGLPALRTTLYTVSVAVSWQEGGGRRVVELDSERLGMAAAGGAGIGAP